MSAAFLRPVRVTLVATSDPMYDQRMSRIAASLHRAGYAVTLLGRERSISTPMAPREYQVHRISQKRVESGKLFYLLFNLKILAYLLRHRADIVCAADLDTIAAVYFASRLCRARRVYDAHELFTDQEEVISRPRTRALWQRIERFCVPRFRWGYTVSESYAAVFRGRYGAEYAVVRNAAVLRPLPALESVDRPPARPYILYQGAVNKGRCFEALIPAMVGVYDAELWIAGEGNFMADAQRLVQEYGVKDRVKFLGYVQPDHLPALTRGAAIGITLFVATSLSNELSLANRFFDYMHAGVPQLGVAYPEYARINAEYEVAVLLKEVTPQTVADALNGLLHDEARRQRMREACLCAREIYNWQAEETRLLTVYRNALASDARPA